MRRLATPALVSIVLLALGHGFIGYLQMPLDQPAELPLAAPAIFLTEFERSTFDERGRLSGRTSGQQMLHYDQKGTAFVDQPVIKLNGANQSRWIIEGRSAIGNDQQRTLMLKGDVAMVGASREGHSAPRHINTSDLHIDELQQIATTEAAVWVSQGNDHMAATGMTLQFGQSEWLELHHRVRAFYAAETN